MRRSWEYTSRNLKADDWSLPHNCCIIKKPGISGSGLGVGDRHLFTYFLSTLFKGNRHCVLTSDIGVQSGDK